MDRIRRALDLARQQRDLGADPAPIPQSAAESSAATAPQLPIVYTNTKVFKPDPALLEANRIVDPSGNDPAVAAFRMLRTQVLQRLDENAWRSMAILSPGADDGKTTTAINLAVSLASDRRHTVLLIDGDLKRPSIGSLLDIKPEFGLDDILRGR
ncbi:MAG: hypothetical protein WA803_00440, partial [Steroidobacteraceae bacterium]